MFCTIHDLIRKKPYCYHPKRLNKLAVPYVPIYTKYNIEVKPILLSAIGHYRLLFFCLDIYCFCWFMIILCCMIYNNAQLNILI